MLRTKGQTMQIQMKQLRWTSSPSREATLPPPFSPLFLKGFCCLGNQIGSREVFSLCYKEGSIFLRVTVLGVTTACLQTVNVINCFEGHNCMFTNSECHYLFWGSQLHVFKQWMSFTVLRVTTAFLQTVNVINCFEGHNCIFANSECH